MSRLSFKKKESIGLPMILCMREGFSHVLCVFFAQTNPKTTLNERHASLRWFNFIKVSPVHLSYNLVIGDLKPTTAQRYRLETETFILEDLFSSVLSQFKTYQPSKNLKFNNSGIFQSLKLRILVEKILPISLNLNFTPNTLGCYGLISEL